MTGLLPSLFTLALLLLGTASAALAGDAGEPLPPTGVVDVSLAVSEETPVALVTSSTGGAFHLFTLLARSGDPEDPWVEQSSWLNLTSRVDADVAVLGGSLWVLYLRSPTLVGLRRVGQGGIDETFPFLDLPAGAEVVELELEASSAGLQALIGLSDGTFRYLAGSAESPPAAPVDLHGLDDGFPLFDRGLSLSANPATTGLTLSRSHFSYVARDGSLATGNVWFNLFAGRLQASETTPGPAPTVASDVGRTSIAMLGDRAVETHDRIVPTEGGPVPGDEVEVRHYSSGSWRTVDSASWREDSRDGVVGSAPDEYFVFHSLESWPGQRVLGLVALSPGGQPWTELAVWPESPGEPRRLAVLPLGDHLAALAWLGGEPGAASTRAWFELVDLGDQFLLLDGFESGSLDAWNP